MSVVRNRRCLVALVVLKALVMAGDAHGESCPSLDPAVAALDAEVRLHFLAEVFDREVRDIDIWSWSWGGVYSTVAIGQGIAIPLTKGSSVHTGLTVGVVAAAVGVLSLTLLPLQITLPMRGVRRDWSNSDRCMLLARAEHVLEAEEKDEALANGIVAHIGNVLVNAGLALILGLGYHQWESAAISAGIGLAVGEANAFSQPHHLKDAAARYRAGALEPDKPKVTWAMVPLLTPEIRGVAFSAAW